MTGHPDCVAHGLAAVNAVHHVSTGNLTIEEISEETLAGVIADVLHLAVAAGLDPDEVLDHGRRYFDADRDDDPGGLLDTDQPQPDEPLCTHAQRLLDLADGLLHCTTCGDVTIQGGATHRLLRRLADHAKDNDGRLVAARPTDDGHIVVGYEFGREAPDSDMAGGAAYATADTLSAALVQVADQVGLPTTTTHRPS